MCRCLLWDLHEAHKCIKNIALTFLAPDTQRDPQIPPDTKTKVWRNMSQRFLWDPH
jgi:hypothetical protein